mmetsp:Transcript_15703/g.28274  ORF Transcript_15703/g.28274 Transcript_15703/m.28274 type:complete len:1025 (-) Transcript_15703:106-3180(-)
MTASNSRVWCNCRSDCGHWNSEEDDQNCQEENVVMVDTEAPDKDKNYPSHIALSWAKDRAHESNEITTDEEKSTEPTVAKLARRNSLSSLDLLQSDTESEACEEPPEFGRERKGGVCAEAIDGRITAQCRYYAKEDKVADKIREALAACILFKALGDEEIASIASMMPVSSVGANEMVMKQGDPGDALFVLINGSVSFYREDRRKFRSVGRLCAKTNGIDNDGDLRSESQPRGEFVRTRLAGTVFGELAIMWNVPRSLSVHTEEPSTLAWLDRAIYLELVVRRHMEQRESRLQLLRNCRLLEMLSHVQISQLVDALRLRVYQDGEYIITQGDVGHELFVVQSGECVVMVKTGQVAADLQEHHRCHKGDFFGERALLKKQPRAANIIAKGRVEALSMSRSSFERLLGPLTLLQEVQYLSDPRKLIADFYMAGDSRGPLGSLKNRHLKPEEQATTAWFAIFRPTSHEAIAKMLGGEAVGKGLNVKGKSAKKNILSGFVPFVQISDNEHKERVAQNSPPPLRGRILIFYKTQAARATARSHFETILQEAFEEDMRKQDSAELPDLLPKDTPGIVDIDGFAPAAYGLEVPDLLLCEAYIMRPDLSPVVGWETGRSSVPAFMEMNLQSLRGDSKPKVVLYQFDTGNPMNPRGLLVAYAEMHVKPVVSDFDVFLIGSRGMAYEPLPQDQLDLVEWSIDCTEDILKNRAGKSWTDQWLDKLKCATDEGYHPDIPEYGFGDSTSYRLIEDVINITAPCGAVRHGPECFNFWFPQELDSEYLIVWHGMPEKPWDYVPEPALRNFLLDRVKEGYSFPLNPVWPLRDKGWYEVLTALKESTAARGPLLSWYPERILERMERLVQEFPAGDAFRESQRMRISTASVASDMDMYCLDLAGCEVADYALDQLKTYSGRHRRTRTSVTVMNFLRKVVRRTTRRRPSRPSWTSTHSTPSGQGAHGRVSTLSGQSADTDASGRTHVSGRTNISVVSKFTARPEVGRSSVRSSRRASSPSHRCCRWRARPVSTLEMGSNEQV